MRRAAGRGGRPAHDGSSPPAPAPPPPGRQMEGEGAAAAGAAGGAAHPPAVRARDVAHHAQPQAAAGDAPADASRPRKKGSKRRGTSSRRTPVPRSATVISTSWPAGRARTPIQGSGPPYLAAFSIRLCTAWRRADGSAWTGGRSGATSRSTRACRSASRPRQSSRAASTTARPPSPAACRRCRPA